MVYSSQKQDSTSEAITSTGWLSRNAETRFIEEEEAGGSTAKSAVSATGSVVQS
jgi:hypothetical protein